MNENNSYNEFSSNSIVVYTKDGGFVGIKQKIFYDHFTKELTFIDERNNTFRVSKLTDNEEKKLANEIVVDKVMDSDQNYPPKEGSADFFSYALFIILGSKSNSVKWTDASETNRFPVVAILPLISADIVFNLLSNVRLLGGKYDNSNPHAFSILLL